MPGLDDFPPERRLALLWRYIAPDRSEAGVDAIVRAASVVPCSTGRNFKRRPDGKIVAVSGSDRRYHLVIDGRVQCADPTTPAEDRICLHQDRYSFWSDGDRYQLRPPPEAMDYTGKFPEVVIGTADHVRYCWLVTLTSETMDPARVRWRDRCTTHNPTVYWPGYAGDNEMGRLRARLVAAFGPLCAACRSQPGGYVDHDHFTGYVRGLLCAFCNAHIDDCPHLSECPFADYLNNPPAASWRTFQPKNRGNRDSTFTAAKIAALGYDPWFTSRAAQRAKEPHRPAPDLATGLDLSTIVDEPLSDNARPLWQSGCR